ncbi:MAG TPA: methyltransferase domain-containing protein [Sideroxyarcus sp.]|nr:methyltransferase domain-containing protein [Sideroxyarcus sp.]
MSGNINNYLTQLLQIHWLRPETALWRTFDCLLMEKYGGISGRAVDLGCGDGTMSFVMAGGVVDEYDVFMDVGELQNYNAGADIYNQNTNIQLKTRQNKLRYTYEWGVDHKQGLIDKAKRFAPFYHKNLVHDLNKKMSFEDGCFDSAFSNILYWLDDMDATLSEWRRILRTQGKLFLFVPNFNFKDKSWLYYSAPHMGDRKYLNYFDRGYNSLIHQCYGTDEWSAIFQKNGFDIVDHHLYLTNPVMDVWNIGTRPIAPLLINMASKLPMEARKETKAEWIDYFYRFFAPIIEGELDRKVSENDAAFHFFVLETK